ncbi:hypothetical protein ERJ75_000220600 [Trypanosoma vivax]|nr:hypothetical protein ERJ75_000372400 [Trypanosoma vivax]KAH8619133.1 hypothetical protein ERJ75_000221100 [Trypanosoma vivax]KAH8619146.1 hypothetical protein ERJ75_000220600 [Trypanosoma vivax]
MGGVPPTLRPLKAYANEIVTMRAPGHDPHLVALASEANRVAEGMWPGSAWEQRMPIMRRPSKLAKERGLEMSGEGVALFIVSLKLAKSSVVWNERALL